MVSDRTIMQKRGPNVIIESNSQIAIPTIKGDIKAQIQTSNIIEDVSSLAKPIRI